MSAVAPRRPTVAPRRPTVAPRRRTVAAVVAALTVGFLLAAGIVWQTSRATLQYSAENPGNSWSTGAVELTDNAAGTALFVPSVNVRPDDPATGCITVNYRGTVAAAVRLYVGPGALTGTLGRYVDLTVEQGSASAGSGPSCAGFTPSSTIWHGTVADFAATHSNFAHGAGTWAPTGATQSEGYRFTVHVVDDNRAQNATATVTFTWEARAALS